MHTICWINRQYDGNDKFILLFIRESYILQGQEFIQLNNIVCRLYKQKCNFRICEPLFFEGISETNIRFFDFACAKTRKSPKLPLFPAPTL